MLLDLLELVLKGRAKRVVSGEEHLIRQQLCISSGIVSLLQSAEITTEGQSLRMLVDRSFHPCKSICYSSSACLHASVPARKAGADFGAYLNYLLRGVPALPSVQPETKRRDPREAADAHKEPGSRAYSSELRSGALQPLYST